MGRIAVVSLGVLAFSLSVCAEGVVLQGRVVDENNAAVGGAEISIVPAVPSPPLRAIASPTGSFNVPVPQPGRYLITAESTGFFILKDRPADLHEGANEIVLVLNHIRNTSETVNVQEAPSPVDIEQTNSVKQLNGRQILDVPYPNTHDLRSALQLMPGVVRGPKGDLHFNGGAENQVLYTLDGFNISDPLTGTFTTHLSVESVRSLTYSSGRYSPEFGKGSAGALGIRTETGDDHFRYSATNFIPGLNTAAGPHVGAWTPRFNLSGPIWKGRAWFSDNADAGYSTSVVEDLPKDANNRTSTTTFSNLLHGQVNLTPGNIIFSDFLVNYLTAPRSGLSALDPVSTTIDRRSREWFASVKDQIYLAKGTLLEIGIADNRTFGRLIPQGEGLYLYTPNGHQGNFYVDSSQRSDRKQLLSNLFLPSFHFAGTHQLKTGTDLDRLDYSQSTRRTGYENFDLSNRLIRKITFGGSGVLNRPSLEASSYVVDAWRVRTNLQVEAGVRQDWDELVRQLVFSPRISASYAPLGWKNTKLAGGYAVVYDATPPQLFAQAQDQYSLTTTYNPDGSVLQGPLVSVFTVANRHLKAPRYQNWSFGAEQRLPGRIQLSVNLLRKRGADGFSYVNTTTAGVSAFQGLPFEGVFNLSNLRKDIYDSGEITLHQAFGSSYEWMASYTRSRALSNAVLGLTVDQSALVTDNAGRLPWDSPNRFLSWGYLPTFWKNWAVAYLLETRDGFPFSIQEVDGTVVGQPDSRRLPLYFSLNLHAEHIFHLQGKRFALRGGFNNITGHKNPITVENTIGSPRFLTYYGSEGRHFVVRFRWLGKE